MGALKHGTISFGCTIYFPIKKNYLPSNSYYLCTMHIQRAMSTSDDVRTSYAWLIAYLKQKYDPKYLCHEMANRSVAKSTNMNELEDMATEAANNPKEHLIKHFMLEACSHHQRQQMRPFLLLSLKEFKFKLKMIVQEDAGRFSGNHGSRGARVDVVSHEAPASVDQDRCGESNQPSTSYTREFPRSPPPSVSGNFKA